MRAAMALLALAALCWGGGAAADDADEFGLLGTWHVLVHYKDANANNPDTPRWDDRVWVFEKKGSRLRWAEYPIVVLHDESGRFERRSTGQYARVLQHWTPSEAQAADIADGLEVNDRGSKSKSLRHRDDAWRSLGRASPSAANVISYVENWSIEQPATLPIFQREDVLGSQATEDLDGVTRYTTTAYDPEAGILTGTYERDGSREGSFRMVRSGPTQAVTGSGLTQGQRATQIPGDGENAAEGEEPSP